MSEVQSRGANLGELLRRLWRVLVGAEAAVTLRGVVLSVIWACGCVSRLHGQCVPCPVVANEAESGQLEGQVGRSTVAHELYRAYLKRVRRSWTMLFPILPQASP